MTDAGEIQVVVFGLGDEEFALPVVSVREILDHQTAFRVPNAPVWLCGLIDVRGLSVPVVDLRQRLGLAPAAATLATRILVVDVTLDDDRALTLGLVVDRVLDVSSFDRGAIEASPDVGIRWRSEHIEGILRRGGGFVVLLDLRHIVAADADLLIGPADEAA